jgi:hypothetical protein
MIDLCMNFDEEVTAFRTAMSTSTCYVLSGDTVLQQGTVTRVTLGVHETELAVQGQHMPKLASALCVLVIFAAFQAQDTWWPSLLTVKGLQKQWDHLHRRLSQ